MTTFNDREKAFEDKYKHDQELQFKVEVRRNKLLGLWLGELLGKHGYKTFGTGKWHNGEAAFIRSFQSGKSVMFGGMSDHFNAPIKDVVGGKAVNPRTGPAHTDQMYADAAICDAHAGDHGAVAHTWIVFSEDQATIDVITEATGAVYLAPPDC